MYATNRANRAAFREEVRSQEMSNPAARPALSARVIPVELPIETQVPTRKIVAIEIPKAEVGVNAEKVVRSLFWILTYIPELRIEDRPEVVARRQIRTAPVEHH